MKIIYIPKGKKHKDNDVSASLLYLFRNNYKAYLSLVYTLFSRDFKSKYKQSILGFIWVFVLPILTTLMFVLLNIAGVLNFEEIDVPYVVFGLFGITFWSVFSSGVSLTSGSLINAGSMVVKINFPKSALVFAASCICIVELLIRLPFLIILLIYFNIDFDLLVLIKVFLMIIPIYAIALAVGFTLSICAGVLRDIVISLPIVVNAFMMLTPVMYPIQEKSFLGQINQWNPLNYLVNVPRDFLLFNKEVPFQYYLLLIFIPVLLILSIRFFYISQTKITERI